MGQTVSGLTLTSEDNLAPNQARLSNSSQQLKQVIKLTHAPSPRGLIKKAGRRIYKAGPVMYEVGRLMYTMKKYGQLNTNNVFGLCTK